MTQRRWSGRGSLAAVAALAGLAAGCGAAQANRRAPGTLTNGSFQPGRPPAAQMGADPGRACPRNPVLDLVVRDLGTEAKAIPQPDGRLCAMAETLIGWEDDKPPQSALRFLASYFGVENPNTAVTVNNFESEDARPIADSLRDRLISMAGQVQGRTRFGISTLRVKKGITRAVLVAEEAAVELQPVPRKLEAGAKAQLRGRLAEPYTHPSVEVTDPQGHLTKVPKASGNEFQADLACGDKAGQISVEIRGELEGAERTVASFPVACGQDLPAALAVRAGAGASKPTDERGLLEAINAERKASGLSELAWDDGVAKAARKLAEQYRDASAAGRPLTADVKGMVRDAGVSSSLVLANPAAEASAAEAQAAFEASPTNRANLLNPETTHAGIGIVAAQNKGRAVTYVVELFVKELVKVDPAEALVKLRQAIADKRKKAGVPALSRDARLDKVAQQYAAELAKTSGKVDKRTDAKLIRPLYRSYGRLNVLAGAKGAPTDFADVDGIQDPDGRQIGVGLAQGASEELGQNALWGVILIGVRTGQK